MFCSLNPFHVLLGYLLGFMALLFILGLHRRPGHWDGFTIWNEADYQPAGRGWLLAHQLWTLVGLIAFDAYLILALRSCP